MRQELLIPVAYGDFWSHARCHVAPAPYSFHLNPGSRVCLTDKNMRVYQKWLSRGQGPAGHRARVPIRGCLWALLWLRRRQEGPGTSRDRLPEASSGQKGRSGRLQSGRPTSQQAQAQAPERGTVPRGQCVSPSGAARSTCQQASLKPTASPSPPQAPSAPPAVVPPPCCQPGHHRRLRAQGQALGPGYGARCPCQACGWAHLVLCPDPRGRCRRSRKAAGPQDPCVAQQGTVTPGFVGSVSGR